MTLKELAIKIGFDVDGSGFRAATSAIAKVGDAIEDLGFIAQGARDAFGFLLGDVVQESTEFAKLAEIMGVSSKVAQQWSYATNQVGIDTKDLIELTAELAENMGEAADSATGEAGKAFKDFGLNIKDANGNLKQTPQFFEEMADAYAKETDARKKASFLTGSLGEQGIAFALLFQNGAEGLRAMRKEADDLGVTLDENTVKKANRFNQALISIKAAFNSLKNAIADTALENLGPLLEDLKEWWKENGGAVRSVAKLLGGILFKSLKIVLSVLGVAGSILGFLLREWRLFALIIGTAVVWALIAFKTQLLFLIGQVYLFAVASVKAGLASFVAWGKALLPLLPYLAALALMILVLDDLWGWYEGRDSLLGRIIDGWREKWEQFIDSMMIDSPGDPWWLASLKDALQTAKDVVGYLKMINPEQAIEDAKSALGSVDDTVQGWAKGAAVSLGLRDAPIAAPAISQAHQDQFSAFATGLINRSGFMSPTLPSNTSNTKSKTINNKIDIHVPPGTQPDMLAKMKTMISDVLAEQGGDENLAIVEQF